MTRHTVLLAMMLAICGAAAESKMEADLRARLAASDAALAKMTAAQAATRARGRAIASDDAKSNATAAEFTAQANAAIAQQAAAVAAAVAASTAAASKNQADEFQRSSDRAGYWLMVTQVFIFLAVVVGIIDKRWADGRQHRWDLEKDEATLKHREEMMGELGVVKGEAHAAYKEANTVNMKLSHIGVQMRDGKPLSDHPVDDEGRVA